MTNQTISILIADDDDGDRKQLRRTLRQTGLACEVVETADLAAAVAACAEQDFDCAIVDYRMPGENGLDGIRALRQRQPNLAIIMVTGQGDEFVASEAIKLGAADYVPKSQITPNHLSYVLTNALTKMALERKIAEQKADLENFAHVLAHDLKTPIHQIQYLAKFIERDIRDQRWDKLPNDCEKIVSTAKRMEDLINTLQHYTRADTPVNFEPVSLDDVLRQCLGNMAQDIAACRARIKTATLPIVHGNGPMLAQLLQNLIGNALKYCRAAFPEIEIGSDLSGGQCRITVKDNGIGIPPEHRKTIFEPFKRLHSADQFEGTGLGLATCRKIVDRHGGRIGCENAHEGGSVFWFTLRHAETT